MMVLSDILISWIFFSISILYMKLKFQYFDRAIWWKCKFLLLLYFRDAHMKSFVIILHFISLPIDATCRCRLFGIKI